MGKEIKLIIADDNRNICQMLQSHLQGQEDLNVVGVAYNGLEALELIQTQEPDLIILDLVMQMHYHIYYNFKLFRKLRWLIYYKLNLL